MGPGGRMSMDPIVCIKLGCLLPVLGCFGVLFLDEKNTNKNSAKSTLTKTSWNTTDVA